MSKIIGVTVGTPISPKKIEEKLNPVKTVNGNAPDENGNVEVVGNNGKDGVSPTVSIIEIGGGQRVSITDVEGTKIFDVMDGKDGSNGKDGTNGSNGKDGADGVDGISATHSWNGTTLTITSASGTSSADLKGEKGDKGEQGEQGIQGERGEKGEQGVQGEKGEQGIQGIQGEAGKDGSNGTNGTNGKDGTSVTVKSVSESTADGGSNVVTFSDNKTITIKNGSKGSKGDKGADGKSAYQYAKDGGYTGTEAQFIAKLNEEIPSWAKASTKPSYTKSEVGLGNVDNVKQYSASNPPPYPVKSVNGQTGAVTGLVETKDYITLVGIDADGVSHSYTIYGKVDDNVPQ